MALSFSCSTRPETTVASPDPARGADDRIGVVIVDDHRLFADGLARLLAGQPDVTVLGVVADAIDALEAVTRLQPRVVLIDYQMPGTDGVVIATQIKRANPENVGMRQKAEAKAERLCARPSRHCRAEKSCRSRSKG